MNIVFDIGGTNMRVAAAEGRELGEIRKVQTLQDPNEGIAVLGRIAQELAPEGVAAAAGDFAGRVTRGVVDQATNLPAWSGLHIEQEITKIVGVPVSVLNDAIVVGLGEAEQGGGKAFDLIAYITVSTGVGGAFINMSNLASSPLLQVDFPELKSRLESQISGTAVRRKFGIEPRDLDSLEERHALADILADGLAEIATIWKPDVFVIGGSMIVGRNPIPLDHIAVRFTGVPVNMAQLGDNGGLIGGAILAERMLQTHEIR